jgi:hypothetical protein
MNPVCIHEKELAFSLSNIFTKSLQEKSADSRHSIQNSDHCPGASYCVLDVSFTQPGGKLGSLDLTGDFLTCKCAK